MHSVVKDVGIRTFKSYAYSLYAIVWCGSRNDASAWSSVPAPGPASLHGSDLLCWMDDYTAQCSRTRASLV